MKKRKKAVIIFELLAALPIVIMLVFGINELFIMTEVNTSVNDAAEQSSRVVAMELRGHKGDIYVGGGEPALSAGMLQNIRVQIEEKVVQTVKDVNFIELSEDHFDNSEVQFVFGDGVTHGAILCNQAIKSESNPRVICVYTVEKEIDGHTHEKVIVRIKIPHDSVTGFYDFMVGRPIVVKGIAHKEMAEPFQYYDGMPQVPIQKPDIVY